MTNRRDCPLHLLAPSAPASRPDAPTTPPQPLQSPWQPRSSPYSRLSTRLLVLGLDGRRKASTPGPLPRKLVLLRTQSERSPSD